MGTIQHEALLISGHCDQFADPLTPAREACIALAAEVDRPWSEHDVAALVSPIVRGLTNGYATFMIAPDGSKLGWDTSDAARAFRDAVEEMLTRQPYSWSFYTARVSYGELGKYLAGKDEVKNPMWDPEPGAPENDETRPTT